MMKVFCDRCGATVDDGENGMLWRVTARLDVRSDYTDGEMRGEEAESFDLCPECYRKMLGDGR